MCKHFVLCKLRHVAHSQWRITGTEQTKNTKNTKHQHTIYKTPTSSILDQHRMKLMIYKCFVLAALLQSYTADWASVEDGEPT